MLVAQSGLTLCDPMDCNPPGSSVHWDFPGKNTGVGCHFLLQGIFSTEGSNLSLGKWVLYQLNYQGSLEIIINEFKKYEHLHAQSWSHVQLFMTLDTVACQAPLSMGFSRQWVAISSSRELNPRLLYLLHWQADSLPLAPPEHLCLF